MKALNYTLILILIFGTLSLKLFAQTYVSGNVSGIWTFENSPYIVTDDIAVHDNDTLKIEPGVELRFEPNTRLSVLENNQWLIARGTVDSVITFTTNKNIPESGDWYGLFFSCSWDRAKLSNCVIEYAEKGITCEAHPNQCENGGNRTIIDSCIFRHNNTGIYCAGTGSSSGVCYPLHSGGNSSPEIKDCIINENNIGIELYAHDYNLSWGTTGPEIKFNLLYNNGNGIYCSGSGSNSPMIINNTIYANTESGIHHTGDFNESAFKIINNIIAKNGSGLNITANLIPIHDYNNIWDNTINYSGIDIAANDISENPLFVNEVNFNLSLRENSPCRDAGDTAIIDRFDGTRSDIGAIQIQQLPLKVVLRDRTNVHSNIFSLGWYKLGNIEKYRLQISNNESFTLLVLNCDIINDNEPVVEIENMILNNKYYWRVAAVNDAGLGEWSDKDEFLVTEFYKIPVGLSPINNQINVGIKGKLHWIETGSGLDYRYRVQVSNDALFKNLIENGTVNGPPFVSAFLKNNRKYYWRVRTENFNCYSPWSETIVFSTISDHSESKVVSDPLISDNEFGGSVSIYNNYAIIGAPGEDADSSHSGAAYIFEKQGDIWLQKVRIKPTDNEEYKRFGDAVAIYENYAISGSQKGDVYVFKRDDLNWNLISKISEPENNHSNYFGSAVALNGNFLVIGSSGDDDMGINSGAAFIYENDNGNFNYITKLFADDATSSANFGSAVGIHKNNLVIGSSSNHKAYFFRNEEGTWIQNYRASFGPFQSYFGKAVSIYNDYAIVGAPGSSYGASYIFKQTCDGWELDTKIEDIDRTSTLYGSSVAIYGDYALVGAPSFINPQWNKYSPSAYLYKRENGNWLFLSKLNAYDPNNNQFGISLAIDKEMIIIGADNYWSVLPGSAYIYDSLWNIPSSPGLVSPDLCAYNITTSPTFRWHTPDDYTAHKIQISKDSTFAENVLSFEGIADTFFKPPNLDYFSKYYWRVKIENAGRNSSWSSVWNFITVPPIPSIPILLYPEKKSSDIGINTHLLWIQNDTVDYFQLQLSSDSDFYDILIDSSNICANEFAVNQLEHEKLYFWRLKAYNYTGKSDWSEIWSFITIPSIPKTPIQSSPSDGAVNQQTSLILSWNPSEGTDCYGLQISTSRDFSKLTIDLNSLSDTYYSLNNLKNNTTYYWRINANNTGGSSDWSEIWSFTILPSIPATPIQSSPTDGLVNQPTSLILSWNPSEGADSYGLQLSTFYDFDSLAIDLYGLSETYYSSSDLKNNATYYWRINANNSSGSSEWSEIWSFSTLEITGIHEHDFACCLSIFPIPVNDILFIDGIEDKNVTVSILSRDGKIMKQLKGTGISKIKVDDLPIGVYILKILNSRIIFTQKMVKL